MSLSHKKSRSGDYYTNCMTAEMLNDVEGTRLPGHRVDDYYTAGAKEPPGEWYFAPDQHGNRGDFGLTDGRVFSEDGSDVDAFHDLCKGYNPNGGKQLVQNAGNKNRIALHDFTFTAPKSFSVVWSQIDEEGRKRIQEAQRTAVRDALDFFSEKGAWTRQGKGGHIKTKTQFIAGLFEHGSSRADDPLLHIHATILNVCRRPDGSTGSIETLDAMRWQGAVASIYHSGLAYKLRAMGAAIRMDGKIPEVEGVPRHVLEAFSQRRKAIEEAVEKWQAEHGLTKDASRASRGLLQKATIETRDQKGELSRDDLETLWLERGRELGFSEQEVREVFSLGEPLIQLSQDELLEEARKAVDKLTDMDATFREPALYTAVAVHLCGRASVEDIKAAVDAVRPTLVHTESLVNTETGEVERIYSTREMLVIERDLVARVKEKTPEHQLDAKFVDSFIAAKDQACLQAAMKDAAKRGGNPSDAKGLADEQIAAMRRVALTESQVVVVEGTAGAGKTFTAESIAAMHKAQGYEVHGLSGAWAQALNLQQEAKLDSGRAIAGWLAEIERGKIELSEKTLVILDEAGMVGARDMRNVVRAVQDAGGKLVLLGDTLQQSSVSAGDALRVVVAETGSSRLDVIRRQRKESDREAVHEFFAGKADEGLDRYVGRIHIEADAESTNARIIKDWAQSRAQHPEKSHLILALDNASVDDLNRRAHQARKDAGELGEKSVQLVTMSSKDEHDLVEFSQGDKVVFRVNNRGLSTEETEEGQRAGEVFNRVRGTVEDISESGELTIRNEDGKLIQVNPRDERWQHKDGGLGLQHDYATSIYASQGLTRDVVLVKDHAAMSRKQTGVAFSRHRDDCQVYIDREARYEAKMRHTAADDWHHISEFSDEECVDRMKASYSKAGDKESTLDFDDWRDSQGVKLYPEGELTLQRIDELREHMETAKANERAEQILPFQRESWYELRERDPAQPDQVMAIRDRLADEGIRGSVMIEAEKQGFVTYDADGRVSFNGHRPMDGKVVNRITDGQAEDGALRGRFPPILRGNDKEVHVVRSGQDALALWSNHERQAKPKPTVIVAGDNVKEATSLAHVRNVLAKSEKPIVIHAGPQAVIAHDAQTEERAQKRQARNLAIAAGKSTEQVKQSSEAAPSEGAKKAETMERERAMAQSREKKHRPTLGM